MKVEDVDVVLPTLRHQLLHAAQTAPFVLLQEGQETRLGGWGWG